MPGRLTLCVHRLQNLSIDNMVMVTKKDLQSTMCSSVNAHAHTRPVNRLQRGGAEWWQSGWYSHTRDVWGCCFELLRERDQVPEQKPVSGVQPDGLSADVNRYICLFLCVKDRWLMRTALILTRHRIPQTWRVGVVRGNIKTNLHLESFRTWRWAKTLFYQWAFPWAAHAVHTLLLLVTAGIIFINSIWLQNPHARDSSLWIGSILVSVCSPIRFDEWCWVFACKFMVHFVRKEISDPSVIVRKCGY